MRDSVLQLPDIHWIFQNFTVSGQVPAPLFMAHNEALFKIVSAILYFLTVGGSIQIETTVLRVRNPEYAPRMQYK